MTLQEFDEGLLTWGANLDRWPEDTRSAARQLLETDAEARTLWQEATHFDAILGTASAVEMSQSAVVAKTQINLQTRREGSALLRLLPIGQLIGFGTLAGAGGVAAAFLVPAGANTGALLTLALGGGLQ
ncbi:hypothetical protein [Roseibium sp. SCP14]|uniref:hypothetical protein n=1 Tax=Roseibium sp. SCP14 TaxID=3141375 RepID=UPI00333D87D1